jgi:hypothetical protein
MANSIPPFDTSNGVKGAAVNFLPNTSTVTQTSSVSVVNKASTKSSTDSPSLFGSKGGSSLGATILSGVLGFFTGGLGGMLSGLSGGISGGGGAKPFNFFETALGFFTGGKKSNRDV